MKKLKITEDDKDIVNDWYEEAKEIDLKSLPAFLKKLSKDFEHDYGTTVEAIAAGMIAAAKAMDDALGGITNWQACFVMWRFITHYGLFDDDDILKLVNYKNMLYPQYQDHFLPKISPETWEKLRKQAKKLLEKENPQYPSSPNVKTHWESIVAGNIPFGYTLEEGFDD